MGSALHSNFQGCGQIVKYESAYSLQPIEMPKDTKGECGITDYKPRAPNASFGKTWSLAVLAMAGS